MSIVAITGGTGMVGNALTHALLKEGYEVIIFTRRLPEGRIRMPGVKYAIWDPGSGVIDASAISGTDHIVHLAGAGVADKRWSRARKKEIQDSRVKGGELLVRALMDTPNMVKSIVTASAIGWYGPDPVIPNPEPFTEANPSFDDFLGNTCRLWEESIRPAASMGKRVVTFRTGIILSKTGGTLEEFRKPMRFGVAAILGRGTQVFSWIHLDDLVRMYLMAIKNESMNGIYNAVAPVPVSNRKLSLTLARVRRKKFIPVKVPSFVLKMVLGEMSIEVLKSATISSSKIREAGFVFEFPTIEEALEDIEAGKHFPDQELRVGPRVA